MKPKFHADLARGHKGEAAFLARFPGLMATDGKKGDLVAPDGSKIELKTDYYPMSKTVNYFIERFSSLETLSPGGPWQASKHGCDYFVYYYTVDKQGFVFKVADLVAQMEVLEKTLTPVEVKNVRWTTLGYKVPRKLLIPYAVFNADGTSPELAAWLAKK
jgi:hypothetical protein